MNSVLEVEILVQHKSELTFGEIAELQRAIKAAINNVYGYTPQE